MSFVYVKFCIIHMVGVDWYSKVYFYTYVNVCVYVCMYESNSLCIHIVTYIFIIEIVCVLLDLTSSFKLVYRSFWSML